MLEVSETRIKRKNTNFTQSFLSMIKDDLLDHYEFLGEIAK